MSLINCSLLLHTLICLRVSSDWKFPSPSKYAWIKPALNSLGAVKAKSGTRLTNEQALPCGSSRARDAPVPIVSIINLANDSWLNDVEVDGPYSPWYLRTDTWALSLVPNSVVLLIKWSEIFDILIIFLLILPSAK